MRHLRVLAALAALSTGLGCYNVTYVAKTKTPAMAVQEQQMTFWLVGLVGEHDIQAGQVCPGGVAKIHTTTTFVQGLLTGLTLGIYAPRTAQITCAQ